MSERRTSQYPLGTGREEFERLHFQHRLWSDAAHGLWRRAGISPGWRVLDIGAGPGAASLDLAALVTHAGHVLAIDQSSSFVDYIREEAEARDLGQLHARVADAHDLDALEGVERSSFDLAYARWLFCFVARPDRLIHGLRSFLKPGAVICVHDYFNYITMTPAPRRSSYTRVVEATAKSWRDQGGDPDIVGRLPALLHDEAFVVEHLQVHQRIARPGDTMWHWAATWWKSYMPKLLEWGYIEDSLASEFKADLASMSRERDFLVLPPVYELMARKK